MNFQFLKSSITALLLTCLLPGSAAAFVGIDTSGSGCVRDKIPGFWQHTEHGMVWEFLESGILNCDGVCAYKGGKPVAWTAPSGKSITNMQIFLSSEKVGVGCSMAAQDQIMFINEFGTFRRMKNKP
ncbi:MAG: hypothetical protein GKS01_17400 [Alphaproteobacteria bacterium]|nr:hypothetical protein [Alphaproteobacteria bacterium]